MTITITIHWFNKLTSEFVLNLESYRTLEVPRDSDETQGEKGIKPNTFDWQKVSSLVKRIWKDQQKQDRVCRRICIVWLIEKWSTGVRHEMGNVQVAENLGS